MLRESVPVTAGEVVDATVMHAAALDAFLAAQIARAKAEDVLFSVHLKATMMKVSDPIIFGHAVRAYFPDVFAEYGDALAAAGLEPEQRPGRHPRRPGRAARGRRRSRPAIEQGLADGPALAMVDSDTGITNLHVPSDVIVDASMPAMIRTSGHMWGADGNEHDTLAVIPDSQLRRHLPGGHRRLPGQRRLRPDDDGLGAERRADGPGGRGVRLARQDLRDPAAGTVRVVDEPATVVLEHAVERRRHLADVPDQGRRRSATGSSSP